MNVMNAMKATKMLIEAREAPDVVRRINEASSAYQEIAPRLRTSSSFLTLARGSSDHAAQFLAYLIMARLGRLVTSLPMSLVTLYCSKIVCDGLVSFAFSQSGQSPDLIAPTDYFTKEGAITAAFVNDVDSPLALSARYVFPLHAGKEESVAATKSFIAELACGAHLVSAWQTDDADLREALMRLPEALAKAVIAGEKEWARSKVIDVLAKADRLFVIGRGTGLPIAMEAALKLKETCAIQAEAFSGAEVKHGPMALIEEGYPLLIFAPRGPAQAGLLSLAEEMKNRGARVLLATTAGAAGAAGDGLTLPIQETHTPDLDPIAIIQSFYCLAESVARARGLDPDHPRHLAKVTRTH
jgi:glutamine---fructose-6-phosphate transaminase (isomerizing)